MSQNDKPKLDELQKLLRRLERVESDKSDRALSEDAPDTSGKTATSDTTQPSATKTFINNSANVTTANGPVSVVANAAQLGSAEDETKPTSEVGSGKNPGGLPASENLKRGLPTPSQAKSATGHQTVAPSNGKQAGDIRDPAKPSTNGTSLDPDKATSKPGESGGDKQHLARMVYRGTARDLPREDGVPELNRPPDRASDQPPFQLPALPDTRSREIAEGQDEKARSGSSIGVVLVAAITAAVVSTVAAVLITIWVIRGGGFGGPNDTVLSASRSTQAVAETGSKAVSKADATEATSTAGSPTAASTTGTSPIEPPAADPPPESAIVSLGEPASGSLAPPDSADAAAQNIAAAIASDQPPQDAQAIQSGASSQAEPSAADPSTEPTAGESQDGSSAAVDLSAITNTAPEPDKSEMVSALSASDPQAGYGDLQPGASSSSGSLSDGATTTPGSDDADKPAASLAESPPDAPQPANGRDAETELAADNQPFAQVSSEDAAEPSKVSLSEPLSPPLEGPDNPEVATSERLANDAAVEITEPASATETARTSSPSDPLATEAAGSGADSSSTTALTSYADTSAATTSSPAAQRGDALAFNDTSLNGDAAQTEQAVVPATEPATRAADQPSDAETAPASDSAGAFTPPKPRAPYALNNPTQLEITPGVSFEFPLRIEAPATANLDNHFLIVSGLKRGARFSQGVELMFDTWQVQANNLDQLRLTIPAGFARELPLTIELRRPDGMSVVRTNLLLTASGSVERLSLPAALFEKESQALPAEVLSKVREGERAIDNGNLRGARLALQEAALQTSAVAALMLAMSYDPRHVEKFGDPTGSNADVAAARQWYGRASSFGAEIATTLSRGL